VAKHQIIWGANYFVEHPIHGSKGWIVWDKGQPLGVVLTWHTTDGTVRRWVVWQGPRANNIAIVARVAGGNDTRLLMGRDRFLGALRKRLAMSKRLFTE
jgi:hypothetical protein